MAYTPKTWTTGETITAAELNAIEQAAAAAAAAADTANSGLASKVNSSTYTAGLAGKADLVAGAVPDTQLPSRLSDASLKAAYVPSVTPQRGGTIPTSIAAPTDLRGLAVWLDASTIAGLSNGAAVASWADTSGNARHAVQATAANQPTYVTGALNGKPVVRFNGTSHALVAPYRGEPGTVIVVGKNTGTGNRSWLGAKSAEGTTIDAWYFQANSAGSTQQFSRADARSATALQNIAQIPTNVTSYRAQVGTFDAATRTLALFDGGGYGQRVRTTATGSRPTRPAAAMAVGAAYRAQALSDFVAGDIAEVLVYDRKLTDDELNLLGAYLAAKWAITWTPIVTPAPVSAQYVLASFTYDTPKTPFHIYASDDGATFKHVNGGIPAFAGTQGDSRDPSIMRHTDGFYYVLYTHSYQSNSFGLARSADLITWEWVQDIAPNTAGVYASWAPEWFVDDDGSVYILITLSTDAGATYQLWLMKANDATLTSWATPVKITGTGLPTTMIDGQLVKIGATYYLWYKGPTYAERVKSTSLTSGYTADKSGNWGGWAVPSGNGYEGPSLYHVNGKWRLLGDDGILKYSDSDDDTASAAWSSFTPVTLDLPAGRAMRHGTVIKGERGGTGAPVPRPAVGGGTVTGLATVATTGSYNDLINKPSASNVAVGAQVYMATNQTLAAAASDTQIKFASTAWSYGGVALNTSGQNGITVPSKGLYMLFGSANLYVSVAGYRSVIVYVNYTRVGEFGRDGDAQEQDNWMATMPLVLNANDFISLNAYTNGAASTIAGNPAGNLTWMSLMLVGSVP